MIYDVLDLEVYRESLRLLKELYEFLRIFPKSEFDTVSQLKRAGKSIPANIAEGFAKRKSEAEFKRFLKISIGSSDEVISHFRAVAMTLPRYSLGAKNLAEKYKVLSKRINKLCTIWHSD